MVLTTKGESMGITLTNQQWVEVYYALESKLASPVVCEDKKWIKELKAIQRIIEKQQTV
jgi:hypothetical protein